MPPVTAHPQDARRAAAWEATDPLHRQDEGLDTDGSEDLLDARSQGDVDLADVSEGEVEIPLGYPAKMREPVPETADAQLYVIG